jgi:hypothetical protein
VSRRTLSQRERVRRMLVDAGDAGVVTSQFLGVHIPRFGARVLELRQEGYEISTERVRAGEARYTLVREPERPTPRPAPQSDPPEQHADDARLFDGFERRPLGYGEDV